MVETCIECGKPATCTRHTQFAGDHPYCEEHGMEQEDYFVDDSYTYWTKENILAGALQHDDGIGYEESTHEKQAEFARKRNYHISNTDNPIDFPEWDNWRPIKDL